MYENFYAVIMAGGSGTRLWPFPAKVSRNSRWLLMAKVHSFNRLFNGSQGCSPWSVF